MLVEIGVPEVSALRPAASNQSQCPALSAARMHQHAPQTANSTEILLSLPTEMLVLGKPYCTMAVMRNSDSEPPFSADEAIPPAGL